MTTMKRVLIRVGKQVSLAGVATLLLTGFCFSQPKVSLSPAVGAPTSKTKVSGSGFSPYVAIDIYFDTMDLALTTSNGKGGFS